MKRRVTAIVGAAIAATGLMVGAAQAVPTGARVSVTDFTFTQPVVKIKKGEKVVWSFDEGKHNVTGANGLKSGNKNSGKYKFTFDKVGTFNYRCTIHQPDMDGVVKVKR